MVQVITALVEALETQRLIPYISGSNQTKFAKTLSQHVSLSLKNICKKAEQDLLFDVFDSWISDPFPVLLELGLRKCYMDICHNFKGKVFIARCRTANNLDFNIIQSIPKHSDINSLKCLLSLVDLSTCLSNHALGLPHDLHIHILKSLLPSACLSFSLSIHLSSYSSKVLGWIQNTCASFDYKTWSVNDGTYYLNIDFSAD